MTPTQEQKEITLHDPKPGEVTVIRAFAGTGKSTTLRMWAEAHPNLRVLYLAFNRDMADQARSAFPHNVTCRTTHSLAYAKFGRGYADNGRILPGSWRAKWLAAKLNCRWIEAARVIDVTNAWLQSAAPKLDVDMTRRTIEEIERECRPDKVRRIHDIASSWISQCMKDGPGPEVTHDVYLKRLQLSDADIGGWDVIMLDEAQDTTDCVLDILTRQACARMYVGDEHQAIYEWRGATSALTKVRADHEFSLTISFRLAPETAARVTQVLQSLRGETRTIVGAGAGTSAKKGRMCIGRKNSSLFARAIEEMERGVGAIWWLGKDGLRSYPFAPTMSVYWLVRGRMGQVTDPFIKSFSSIKDMLKYARNVGDLDLLTRHYLVDRYGRDFPDLLAALQEIEAMDAETADLCLTTAHRAKGLEWDEVEMIDDFSGTFVGSAVRKASGKDGVELPGWFCERWDDALSPSVMSGEEANVIYVAASRARSSVIWTPDLERLFRMLDSDAPPRKVDSDADLRQLAKDLGRLKLQTGVDATGLFMTPRMESVLHAKPRGTIDADEALNAHGFDWEGRAI